MAEEKKEVAPMENRNGKATVPKTVKAGFKPLIYVGPTIKGTLLRTFRIFADGVPEEYQDNAVAKALFVAPGKLNEARAEIGSTGSKLNVFYKQAAEYGLRKGGK